MADVERDLGTHLDWVAVDHDDKTLEVSMLCSPCDRSNRGAVYGERSRGDGGGRAA